MTPEDRTALRVSLRLVEDRERGTVAALDDYLRLFPTHPDVVRREFEALSAKGDPPPTAATWTDEALTPEHARSTDRFGHYRILRLLGRGGQGAVFLAEDERLKRPVALKVLNRGALGVGPEARVRFRREAELAARLSDPGICAVYEAGEVDGAPFLAMRYVEGRTLAEDIRRSGRGAADVARFVRILESVARAVHVAHEAGVVHRDLKPANILLAAGDRPVVLDFGLALGEASPTVTKSGDALGTPAYMSPEQLRGVADRRTDVWALGVTLYEAVVGRRPFDGATTFAAQKSVAEDKAPSAREQNRSVPYDLDVVIHTAIERDLGRRYATTLAFAEDLARVREHKPILARRAGPWLRLRRLVRREPWLSGAALALVVALVVAAVGWRSSGIEGARRAETLIDVRRLADMRRVHDLASRAERFWPPRAGEDRGPTGMEAWLVEAVALRNRSDAHAAAATNVRNAMRTSDVDLDPAWLAEGLDSLARETAALDPLIKDMQARTAFVRDLPRRSIEEPREQWSAAAAAVAADPRFFGLRLVPQSGFVPLGPDPTSGLQEFVLLQTGDAPRRDPRTSQYIVTPETGLVFVLLPGGRRIVGAEGPLDGPPEEDGARYDPHLVAKRDSPWTEVVLKPFFISKWEVTQAAWLRVMPSNPSNFRRRPDHPQVAETLIKPVENTAFDHIDAFVRRTGLRVPRDAEGEFACRGGTETVWWTGDDLGTLVGAAYPSDWEPNPYGEADDQTVGTRAVGSFRANGFGLHEMLGNVCEPVYEVVAEADGFVIPAMRDPRPGRGTRASRGGSKKDSPAMMRSTARRPTLLGEVDILMGFRPARDIDP